jgi:hypothetical protein
MSSADRVHSVPISIFLEGQKFDPETTRVMGIAFEMTRAALRVSNQDELAPETIAKIIIEFAKSGERDPERLCDQALAGLRAPRRFKHVVLLMGNNMCKVGPPYPPQASHTAKADGLVLGLRARPICPPLSRPPGRRQPGLGQNTARRIMTTPPFA